jgi:hypothetical protein
MHTGMLWLSTDANKSLSTKIQEAVDYYVKKYGRTPDLCMVHPSMLVNGTGGTSPIAIRPYRPILPGHIWIGIEDKS